MLSTRCGFCYRHCSKSPQGIVLRPPYARWGGGPGHLCDGQRQQPRLKQGPTWRVGILRYEVTPSVPASSSCIAKPTSCMRTVGPLPQPPAKNPPALPLAAAATVARSTTTDLMPRSARWYAVLAPTYSWVFMGREAGEPRERGRERRWGRGRRRRWRRLCCWWRWGRERRCSWAACFVLQPLSETPLRQHKHVPVANYTA